MKLLKKPKIFFNPISGSSILSITWYSGPLGDAVESNNQNGIGYFGHNGDLLSVQFDDVDAEKDQQVLEFDGFTVECSVKMGKVSFGLIKKKSLKKTTTNDFRL